MDRGSTIPSLAATKLSAPTPPVRLVQRGRLHAVLDAAVAARGRRTVLVSAPAGADKSTLLSDWLSRREERGAWLQLDRFDRDPARFWAAVVASLDRVVEGLDDAVGAATSQAALDPSPVVARIVNAIAIDARPLVLVLDDLHLVEEPAVLDGLEHLLAMAPPQLVVVLATRVDPALPLGRLRVRGELAEVRAADLRFNADEARALVEVDGDALDVDDLATLCERTEGWAAGLVLASLSLASAQDRSGVVAAFRGDDRLVVDYLSEEFLSQQESGDRDRLLRTSVLERFSAPLVDAVCGTDDGWAWLRRMAATNQMVISLDRTATWFRYHHLLSDLLLLEARAELGDELEALHRAAATWHESYGDPHDAVEHRLAAGDLDIAIDLLWDHAADLMNRGQIRTVVGQLERLGPLRRRHPRSLLMDGWIALLAGRAADAWRCLDAAREEDLDEEEAGHVVALTIMRGLAEGDVAAALSAAAASGPPVDSTQAMALGGVLVHAGKHDEARGRLAEAAAAALEERHLFVQAATPIYQAISDLEQGRDASALQHARQSVAVAERNALERTPQLALAHSIIARTADDPAECAAAARHGAALARGAPGRITLAYALTSAADVLCDLDAPDGPDILAEARRVVDRCVDPGITAPYLGRVEARLGDVVVPSAAQAMVEPPTEREIAVLRHLPTRLSQREIAGQLFVSLNTVKTHTRSLYRKLGVGTRKEAVQAARDVGLL